MKQIVYNDIKMYRYYSPFFPDAYIRTEKDKFYSYNPYSKIFIEGGVGWYKINGELRTGKRIYAEEGRIENVPIRRVIYHDGYLSYMPIFVTDKYFLRKIGKSYILFYNGEHIEDIEKIKKIIRQCTL